MDIQKFKHVPELNLIEILTNNSYFSERQQDAIERKVIEVPASFLTLPICEMAHIVYNFSREHKNLPEIQRVFQNLYMVVGKNTELESLYIAQEGVWAFGKDEHPKTHLKIQIPNNAKPQYLHDRLSIPVDDIVLYHKLIFHDKKNR